MSRTVKAGGGRVVDGVVFDARAEAAQIITEAHAAADCIRESARAEGRDQGRAEVAALLLKAGEAADQLRTAAADGICTLAVHIAERIVRRHLELSPEGVVEIARAALADARTRDQLVLRVHPKDVEILEARRPSLLAHLSVSAQLIIRADTAITRGGCVVDTEVGTVDARLETQLAAIERALSESS